MDSHRDVNGHWPGLTDPVGAVRRLIFNGRIPPAGQMDHIVCCGDREPHAASLGRQDENVE